MYRKLYRWPNEHFKKRKNKLETVWIAIKESFEKGSKTI